MEEIWSNGNRAGRMELKKYLTFLCSLSEMMRFGLCLSVSRFYSSVFMSVRVSVMIYGYEIQIR